MKNGQFDTIVDQSFGNEGHYVSADGYSQWVKDMSYEDASAWRSKWGKSGTKLSFEDWMKRQYNKRQAAGVGKTVLEGFLEMWKRRPARDTTGTGDYADTGYGADIPDEPNRIMGMPSGLAIGIFVIVGVAAAYGIVRLATRGGTKPKSK